ncbi:MAG: ORF6N domain-containing protein [Gammaproteobacteria bacterium]|nr:MAG: ORF6N domain-containing protein [Gammaproteobacteria bacterium]
MRAVSRRRSLSLSARSRTSLTSIEDVSRAIVVFRGCKVLLDAELAALYGVTTKRLNEQVLRNRERFPTDFMFQLTAQEAATLRSQFATLKSGRGQHRKYLPYAFTEHGAIMAASVLNSPRAVEMSVYVVRAFVRLRELLATNRAFARKLDELESRLQTHDEAITGILRTLRELMNPPASERRGIGFTADLKVGK